MKWLIAIAVIAFMLAPLIWIIPTPRQARQRRIRERARQRGLQVKVLAMPQSRRELVRKEAPRQGLCYSLVLSRREPAETWRYWFDQDVYERHDDVLPTANIVECIAGLASHWPRDAYVLECNGYALQLYWFERGADEPLVDKLADGLESLKKELHLGG